MGERYDKALEFAKKAHAGITRKTSDAPYIVHPIETAEIVANMGCDEDMVIAALLHDVIEDTRYDENDIEALFGKRVRDLVLAESEDKRREQKASDSWKIRKQETIDHLKTASKEIKILALADKLSNLRSMKTDYDKMGEDLWNCFNQKDKNEHGWYHKAIADVTADLSVYDEWKEYNKLCHEIFD